MNFTPGKLPGVWVIDLEPRGDERGSLTKSFCSETFAAQGLNTTWAQQLSTHTVEAGTIRGMHWQADPHPETKLIRCTQGQVYDVLVDVRKGSETFGKWEGYELAGDIPRAIYAPAGFAHGLQTLEPNSMMTYLISTPYHDDLQRGLRWDDPDVAIPWPHNRPTSSPKDNQLPTLSQL